MSRQPNCEQSAVGRYPLPATRYPLPATRYPLPATRYPLPATRYPLGPMVDDLVADS